MAVRTGGYESSSQPGTGCHHQPSSRSEPGKSFILTIHPLPVSDDAQFRFSFSNTLLFPRMPLYSSSGGGVHFQRVKPPQSQSGRRCTVPAVVAKSTFLYLWGTRRAQC